jgi:hypothetical protein
MAMGDVDELNSHIGLLLCEDMPADVRELLIDIQHQLFNLGGELSIPGFELLKDDALAAARRRAGAPQRHPAAPAGIHPAGRHPRRRAGPHLPHRGPPRRTRRGGAGQPKRCARRRATTSTACRI